VTVAKLTLTPSLSSARPSHPSLAPPMNLTVLSSDSSSRASFLSPSGVLPTPDAGPRTNSPPEKTCPLCLKQFPRPSQLALHMNIHAMERPYRCLACQVSFRSSGHLQKHKRSASHYNKVNMNLTFGAATSANPRPFKCLDCSVAFRIHGHLAKHLRSKLHVLRLECLHKLPFGVYAEMERSGHSLAAIDTTDCESSLLSLQVISRKLFPGTPLPTPPSPPLPTDPRERTVSESSATSDDTPREEDFGDETDESRSPLGQSETSGASPSPSTPA